LATDPTIRHPARVLCDRAAAGGDGAHTDALFPLAALISGQESHKAALGA